MSFAKNIQVAGFARYLRLVERTSHVSVARAISGSALVTFWHDAIFCLLAATMAERNVAIYVRAQPHIQDTLDLLASLGLRTFVSDNQGTSVIKAAREWLSEPGRLLAVTLDRQEPHVAESGVARLARMLSVPLCPLSVSASRGYHTSGWDRCVVPHLGGRLTIRALAPVTYESIAASTLSAQRALTAATLVAPSSTPLVPWRRAFEAWPRVCLMPRTRGKLTVWPATEPVKISF